MLIRMVLLWLFVGVAGAALAVGVDPISNGGGERPSTRLPTGAFSRIIPADKNLSPAWVQSLTERGVPTVCTGAALMKIGMPVGGLCCGTLYLGGDGKLWIWDVFNRNEQGVISRITPYDGSRPSFRPYASKKLRPQDGARYVDPATDQPSLIEQGFALRVTSGDRMSIRTLDRKGWGHVSFTGTYPVGTVDYEDESCPVRVRLQAFSPFIPLNADDSSIPATLMSYSLTNTGADAVSVEIGGWVENGVVASRNERGVRSNRIETDAQMTRLVCSGTGNPAAADYGSLVLAVLGGGSDSGMAVLDSERLPGALFTKEDTARKVDPVKPIGSVVRKLVIGPGESKTVVFALAWYFPNVKLNIQGAETGRHYRKRFASAVEVASYLAVNQARLTAATLLWRDTWYDSTLPYWFLDRTFVNVSTLATATAFRFATGRFYGWEGVGVCAGTCTHVWHYGQAMGRLFPEFERSVREMVDFGLAFDEKTGMIKYRGECEPYPAVDGQCGRILGMLREHQMSTDDRFLRNKWPQVKKAIHWLDRLDSDGDGILDRGQQNTLDAAWYGQIPWISSLYAAALLAGAEMASDMGDLEFARECQTRAATSRKSIEAKLFNGEWFIQIKDPAYPKAFGSYNGCAIDQVLGQSWAWQVGLGRVLDRDKTLSALRSLWKYNFAPDIGPFLDHVPPMQKGRPLCLPGEGGLVMVTNPLMEPMPYGGNHWTVIYFNECMSGFEHQVASHMIAEGMVMEGLAVTRAIHDRYRAEKRNPYNEIECSDHYARAMASYGTFISACGFTCDGPKGMIGFAPRLSPENFKAAFTAAGGWGTFTQRRTGMGLCATIEVKYGVVNLQSVRLVFPAGKPATRTTVTVDGLALPAEVTTKDGTSVVTLSKRVEIPSGSVLAVELK